MIVGVGCDVIEIKRIEKALKETGFAERCFTERERQCFEKRKWNAQSVAASFAAKEAVSKALGTGIRGFSWQNIEILHEENGRPYAVLSGGAADKLCGKVSVTMSHTDEVAIAYAVIDKQ